jgi:CelD/BcsL family acetyltransferase involved in cellulose biosynthesis
MPQPGLAGGSDHCHRAIGKARKFHEAPDTRPAFRYASSKPLIRRRDTPGEGAFMAGTGPGPVREAIGLASLREEWAEIHRHAPRATTFNGFEHVALWYRQFASPDAVRVFPVRQGGRTLGFLPLVAERRKGIRFLRSLTNAHCVHGGALVGASAEGAFAAAVIETLARERSWDVLLLENEFSFDGADLLPCDSLRGARLRWQKAEIPTFVIDVGRPFDEYFRRDLSKKRRNYVMNYLHRVERAGGAEFEHLNGAEALAAWDEFVAIEDSGWKGAAGTSIRRETLACREYYRGLLEILAAQGRLRISFMSMGGRRIAGGFGHVQGRIFHLSKVGYRQDDASFAPSNLLLLQLIKDVGRISGDVRIIHLYPWDHGYKHRFVNQAASSVSTYLFNGTLRGHAARLWRARRAAGSPAGAEDVPAAGGGGRPVPTADGVRLRGDTAGGGTT